MSAISKPTAGTVTGGLTLAQLQAEATNQGELDTSLSAISQAVATLGSQLQSAGAVPGELRVFRADVAPSHWTEVDRNTPPTLVFNGSNRNLMCSARALTSVTSNTQSIYVAGEHGGYVYYMLTPANGSAYLERMSVATGETSAVATHPYTSFDNTGSLFSTPITAIVGDYLYAFGGRGSLAGAKVLTQTYRINLLNTGAGWAQLQSVPVAIATAGVAVVGSKIYSVGGITNVSTPYPTNAVLVFDTATLAWTTLSATLPFGSVENCLVAPTADGQLLCVGGWSGGAEVKKFALLNLATGQFGSALDLPTAFADRPRCLFRMPGSTVVNGIAWDGARHSLVQFDGTWTDLGIKARSAGNMMGSVALSDGTVFIPSSLTVYQMPHAKYAINSAQAADKRLLCAYTG